MDRYGLVLAGGGGKGAYQMGAWKALREMGITFDAIAGVSIGSINGALIAQGDYDKAMEMWNSVSIDKGVKITHALPDPDNLFSKKNWPALFREVIKNGGLDASPLAEYIKNYIDEKKIREKNIPLGIVTVQLNQKASGLELFIDDIPEGELVDYLLASSSIPLVTNIGPEGEKYLDGGVYDNTPVMTLKKRGYNKLIVIDISNIKGVAHNLDFSNSRVVYIKPYKSEDLGAAFDFDAELNQKRMDMGYLDTKKAFGELSGNIFHFLPSVFRDLVMKYGADEIYQLELLGHKLGVEKGIIYSEETFIPTIKIAYEKEKAELLAKEEAKNRPSEDKRSEKKAEEAVPAEPSFAVIEEIPEEKNADSNVFHLTSLKNYFAQKKAEFEEFEKEILIAREEAKNKLAESEEISPDDPLPAEPAFIVVDDSNEEKTSFNLSSLKNYFIQKRAEFEEFQNEILIAREEAKKKSVEEETETEEIEPVDALPAEPTFIVVDDPYEEKESAEKPFKLNLLKNYFSQKKTGFEGFEKAVEVLEKM